MRATDETPTPRRTDRSACRWCEATPSGCRSLSWLSGRYCCEACAGNHDSDTHPHLNDNQRSNA